MGCCWHAGHPQVLPNTHAGEEEGLMRAVGAPCGCSIAPRSTWMHCAPHHERLVNWMQGLVPASGDWFKLFGVVTFSMKRAIGWAVDPTETGKRQAAKRGIKLQHRLDKKKKSCSTAQIMTLGRTPEIQSIGQVLQPISWKFCSGLQAFKA